MPGPLIVSVSTPSGGGAIASTSITAIRRVLGPLVGPFAVIQTTGTPGGPDGLRSVISTTLRDPAGPRSKYDSRYAYVTTGDNTGFCSRVFAGGFEGASGTVYLSQPFAAELDSGSTVELSAPLPAVTDGDLFGLNDAIRSALWGMDILIDLDVVMVDQQVRYTLAGLPWVLRREEVLDLYPPIPTGSTAEQVVPTPASRASWDVEYDGEAPYLVLKDGGYTAGETFFLKVRRKAATWVRSGGVWGSSETGPADETAGSDPDEVVYDAPTVARAALPIALERLVEYYRAQGDLKQVAAYEKRLAETQTAGRLSRWLRGFRGNGAQRVGAR